MKSWDIKRANSNPTRPTAEIYRYLTINLIGVGINQITNMNFIAPLPDYGLTFTTFACNLGLLPNISDWELKIYKIVISNTRYEETLLQTDLIF